MIGKYLVSLIALISAINAIPPQDKIVGGVQVNPRFKYPWLVSIQVGGRHFCGGNILNPTTVLTAAHCSQEDPSSYTVNVHRHNLQQSSESEGGQTLTVESINSHPEYDANNFHNDVSVWKLSEPATVDIGTLNIDDGSLANQTGLRVLAAGWGVTYQGGPASPILREVAIPIVDMNQCINVWSYQGLQVSDSLQVCAAGQGGKDACNGDSGGPLFVYQNGQATLIGTTSFGQPCAHAGYPTVWARTSAFSDFIQQYL